MSTPRYYIVLHAAFASFSLPHRMAQDTAIELSGRRPQNFSQETVGKAAFPKVCSLRSTSEKTRGQVFILDLLVFTFPGEAV
jgi:hypothetical protein